MAAEATMVPEAQLTQVARDLHQRVTQLKREKQEQMEALAKQNIQIPTFSGGLWSRCTAWLSTSQVKPYEKVAKVITERG
jgi:hypothetical protein